MKIIEQANRFTLVAKTKPNPEHHLRYMLRYTQDVQTKAAYILALRCLGFNDVPKKENKSALEYLERIDLTTFMAPSSSYLKAMPMPDKANMLGREGCRQLKAKRNQDGYGETLRKGTYKNPHQVKRHDERLGY